MLLVSALERNYFSDKWIADQTLVIIFYNDYSLDFTVKRYINRYPPYKLFDGINIHHEITTGKINLI